MSDYTVASDREPNRKKRKHDEIAGEFNRASTQEPENKKHKYEEEIKGKTIMARVIFENLVASEPFLLPADDAINLFNLIQAITEEVPMVDNPKIGVNARDQTFHGKKRYPPFFVLQKTSIGNHRMYAHSRYVVLSTNPDPHRDPNRHYSWWRKRNLVQGTEDGLRIEIHIHLKEDCPSLEKDKLVSDLCKEFRVTAEFNILSDYPLRQVMLEDIHKPLSEWYPGLLIPVIPTVEAPMSKDIFPGGEIVDPLRYHPNCGLCTLDAYLKGLWDFSEEEIREAQANEHANLDGR